MTTPHEDDADRSPPLRATAPQSIRRLPEDVVNRIAAGEIIVRPANALKEMMENSLDAGATMIRVQLRDGGLKLLQIQDDGHGVAREDLPLLCERFATSKLRSFSDLSSMTTFGFRGEALASISYVSASMTIFTRTAGSETAFKASYSSGQLVAPKPGQSAEPKPCAGSKGTFIVAEDLFFNVPQRKRALKSAAEEYALALDVMSKYAVHYGSQGVGFSCKKANSATMDLSVPSSEQMTSKEVIAIVYGSKIAKELTLFGPERDAKLGVSITGWASGPNWNQSKRPMFILFINNRLVDSATLRRAVMALYSAILPKGAYPWVYISLHIDEQNLDVNVHPTKKEVHFLHEEDIVEAVCTCLQAALTRVDVGRSFTTTQSVLVQPSSSSTPTAEPLGEKRAGPMPSGSKVSQSAGYPQHTVRVDPRARTLDGMNAFTPRHDPQVPVERRSQRAQTSESFEAREDEDETDEGVVAATQSGALDITESQTDLESVFELRHAVQSNEDREAAEVLRSQSFVGIIDTSKRMLLLQHLTKLYLVQYAAVVEQMAFQLLLKQFGQMKRFRLEPAPFLDDLVRAALQAQTSESHKGRLALGVSEEMVIEHVSKTFDQHAEMFAEYFAVGVERDLDDRSGLSKLRLTTLPNLFGGSAAFSARASVAEVLQLERIPTLLLRLATQVDYSDEKRCFHGVLSELAFLFVPLPTATQSDEQRLAAENQKAKRAWTQVWQPVMPFFRPSKQLAKEGRIVSIANLPSLYSIFERC